MDLTSPIFDRIRTKRQLKTAPAVERNTAIECDFPGCGERGAFRAPMGRDREGQYFCFCLDHVRQYNAGYNYFSGMTEEDVSRWLKDALVGHRPTWALGRGAEDGVARTASPGARFLQRNMPAQPKAPRYGLVAMKALTTLGLDDTADAPAIRVRYKELVKRLHPDANSGDRSNEGKLREIIQAYKHLRSAKLV